MLRLERIARAHSSLRDVQAALFPTGRSGLSEIRVGQWRDDAHGPMQVVSGPIGRQKIHFQAPPADGWRRAIDRLLAGRGAVAGWRA
ncbi:MAG: hypothetical protein J0H15_01575 [Xanthomonadales bacterium]|nr:hypothetical protein [Xanthomonadales bacterium]